MGRYLQVINKIEAGTRGVADRDISDRSDKSLRDRYTMPTGVGDDAELDEIERRVNETGFCLSWSAVLDDFVAFISSDADLSKVPNGFIAYTLSELRTLCPDDGNDLGAEALRLIHYAKKLGEGRIVSNDAEEATS